MSASLKFIKNITNNESLTTYQLVLNSLFGNNLPKEYDSSKIYFKGDPIITISPNGNYLLKVADEDNITGFYNDDKWTTVYFTSIFGQGSSLGVDFTKAIQISITQPEDKDNRIWFKPVNIKEGNINVGEMDNAYNINVYENEHFAAQYDEPIDKPEVRLWLDYE